MKGIVQVGFQRLWGIWQGSTLRLGRSLEGELWPVDWLRDTTGAWSQNASMHKLEPRSIELFHQILDWNGMYGFRSWTRPVQVFPQKYFCLCLAKTSKLKQR